ncbi:MAG: cupin domain-containing protein, partial [Myxococcota bacterium]
MADKIDLAERLSAVTAPWTPMIVGELNGQHVKLAKFDGSFVWHRHEDVDELFLVLRGRIRVCLRDREITLGEGEMLIVPRGVEHKPVADEPADVLIF